MLTQNIRINNIPSILWGEKSDKIYIYVHGKMSCKEYAEQFAKIAQEKGYQTLSFDLPEHGERQGSDYRCDIINGMNDLSLIGNYVFSNWNNVSLFACSLGAYFSLNAYGKRKFSKCLFQSPILNMEYVIRQMFLWYDITEERLCLEKEITTPLDTLSWDYFQYVLKHPIKDWNIPTWILYGEKDNLQPLEVIQTFVEAHNCKLRVSKNSEHPFMQSEDIKTVEKWLKTNI